MYTRETKNEDTKLDDAINELYSEMAGFTGETEEYATIVDQLAKLYALKEDNSKKRISPDTLALVIGNLLGIILIVGHERANVVTSRAIGFVLKVIR